jgi:hypothetical protein
MNLTREFFFGIQNSIERKDIEKLSHRKTKKKPFTDRTWKLSWDSNPCFKIFYFKFTVGFFSTWILLRSGSFFYH